MATRAEGRAGADASSCVEAWRGQRLSAAWQAAEEINAFHQKDASGWMACDKRCYWIFGDFHQLVATARADCNAFTIYIPFPTLYFQQKVRFWKEDNVFLMLHLHAKHCRWSHNLWLRERRIPIWFWRGSLPSTLELPRRTSARRWRTSSLAKSSCGTLRWWRPALLRGNSRQKKGGIKAHLPPSAHYGSSQGHRAHVRT